MPFDTEAFFAVFGRYNLAIWPVQPLAYAAGLVALAILLRGGRTAGIGVPVILAAMWALNGIGYHILQFSTINPVAPAFGAVFLVQSALLAAAPLIWGDLRFDWRADLRGWSAALIIAYAMAAYPLLSRLAGHRWPEAPEFGVAPCPTTIFTIGVLLLAPWRSARWLLAIPALWALVGGSATVLLGVPQDAGLPAALAIALAFTVVARRSETQLR